MTELEAFFTGYITTALSLSFDDNDVPLNVGHDMYDIDVKTIKVMQEDCKQFFEANTSHIRTDGAPFSEWTDELDSYNKRAAHVAGYDFWLTRNGHGAGFWDGDWPAPQATFLTDASEEIGSFELYLGDDGRIYHY